jgi:hypothetical protein
MPPPEQDKFTTNNNRFSFHLLRGQGFLKQKRSVRLRHSNREGTKYAKGKHLQVRAKEIDTPRSTKKKFWVRNKERAAEPSPGVGGHGSIVPWVCIVSEHTIEKK